MCDVGLIEDEEEVTEALDDLLLLLLLLLLPKELRAAAAAERVALSAAASTASALSDTMGLSSKTRECGLDWWVHWGYVSEWISSGVGKGYRKKGL